MRSTLVDIHDLLKGQIRPAYSSTNFPRATTGNGAQVVAQRGKEGTVRMSPSEATFSRCLKFWGVSPQIGLVFGLDNTNNGMYRLLCTGCIT
jgi:hypothetical protein